jgi:hypothetical protein
MRVALAEDGRSNWTPPGAVQKAPQDNAVDTDRIAFRKVAIEGIEFSYMDPRRRRPVNAVIETVTVAPDANDVLDLDLRGTINEFPLWADGKLGPWQNFLDGRDITADFDLTLGQIRLSLAGSAEDLVFLEGIMAEATLTGPEVGRVIERFGLPPFAEGAFGVEARVIQHDGGHQVRVEGNVGAIDVLVGGTVDRLAAIRHADLDFSAAGPDTQNLLELFGVSGAPAEPFRVAGGVSLDETLVGFSDVRISVGPSTIGVDGTVDFAADTPDGELAITAQGPDFSVLGPFVKRAGLPREAFNVAGEISKRGSNWEVRGLEALVGENRLSADGSMTVGRRADSAIVFRATGPDIAFLQDFTELQGLPEQPFDVQASLRSDPAGIAVRDAFGVVGDNRLELEGTVSNQPGLVGSSLRARASGPELKNIAVVAGIPHLPTGPFDISARVELVTELVRFHEASAQVGELIATGSGEAGLGARAGYLEFTVDLRAPDVAQFAAIEYLEPFAGEPLAVTGKFRKTGEGLELTNAQADLGEFHAAADGILSLSPLSNDSDLGFTVRGPSMERIGRMFDSDMLLDKPFDIAGKFTGTPSGFAMREFTAHVGDSDITGDITADLRGVPRITGSLTSDYLDLRERRQASADDEEPSEESEADESGFVFSDRPFDGRRLNAANIDLELHAARLRTSALDVTDFQIGFRLWDGELRVDPIRMTEAEGSLSGRLGLLPGEDGYTFDTLIEADQLHLGFASTENQDLSTLPAVSGRIELRGAGNSLHQILASSNGQVAVRQGEGEVKEFFAAILFKDVVLEALRTINPLRKDSKSRRLDCGIYQVSIAEGVATFDKVAMQTNQLLLLATGNIDFETEKLNINFRAKPREGLGVSLGTLANSFLGVRGTMRSPKVGLDAAGSVTTTGAAVATGGLSILARGLWDRLSSEKDICKEVSSASPD